jgi:DNA-binding MarR family transcriptional regulator
MPRTGTHKTQACGTRARLRSLAFDLLESLYQHRLLTTSQLRILHAPDRSRRWTQRVIAELEQAGLVAHVQNRGSLRVWFLTETGAELAEALPDLVEERLKLLDARQAAGALQAHTLAVNDVGIAFLEAARSRGDEFTPRSWRHEVAHPIGPPPGMRRGELLIADAVFTYLYRTADNLSLHYRFVELDRGTLPSYKLAAKLARYARLYRFRPRAAKGERREQAWRAHYPVFPAVLVVFAGRPRAALERRLRLIGDLCAIEPHLERTGQVQIHLCLLEDLGRAGPFAPIFTDVAAPTRRINWLGDKAPGDGGCADSAQEDGI